MKEQDILAERLQLAVERLSEICKDDSERQSLEGSSETVPESLGDPALEAYFEFCARFLLSMHETAFFLQAGGLRSASVWELESRNREMYADILPERYGESYGNPAYAVRTLGWERGQELCFLYTELRSLIAFVYEGLLEEVVIRMELFLEVYAAFVYAASAGEELPGKAQIRQILYWFVSDYADVAAERSLKGRLGIGDCFVADIIQNSDLEDVRYLYGYGEYVGEDELETARFMAGLSQETVNEMADAYTERFLAETSAKGTEISPKSVVELHYHLGCERMIRRAMKNFQEKGLKPVVCRAVFGVPKKGGFYKNGFCGGIPNRQFAYDHKDDKALFLDKNYVNRWLSAVHAACDRYRLQVSCAGGAVMENFEEMNFTPEEKKEALRLTKEQNRLMAEYRARAEELRREYRLTSLPPGRL